MMSADLKTGQYGLPLTLTLMQDAAEHASYENNPSTGYASTACFTRALRLRLSSSVARANKLKG